MRLGMRPGQVSPTPKIKLSRFDVDVFNGSRWVPLNDHLNYEVGANSLTATQQSRRNHTASSPLYDGEWIVHSSLSNTQETLQVYVYGSDQNQLALNIQDLIDWFSQGFYRLRVIRNNDVEVYDCFPADYQVDRSHVLSHNGRASVTFTVPRLPQITREVVE